MTKSRRRSLRRTVPSRPRRLPRTAVVVPAVALLAAGLWWGKQHPHTAPVLSPVAAASTSQPPTVPDFRKLVGRWLRPDGGYVLAIRSIDAKGKLDASYLNPKPIHVARAEASQDGAALKVLLELRDANYPGSTYTLVYEPQRDQLQGLYYHAGLRQIFDVVFVRWQA